MTRTSYLPCALILVFGLGCMDEGLRSADAGAGIDQASLGGSRRGPAHVDAQPSLPPDVGSTDVLYAVEIRGEVGGTDMVTSSPDLAPDLTMPADASADMAPYVPEAGRESSLPDAGVEVGLDFRPILPEVGPEASPDLRPILPEAGPEAKKCATECNTGCNIGCGPNGQCVACATCTCEIASGTCHC